ncbi:MAG: ATP-binding protein [Bacteroidota bacterium]
MEKTLEQIPSDCLRIVLFGPESTGKTTLARQLATHFKTQWVPEYMRTYLQKKWDLQGETIIREDLLPIAKGQIASENELSKKADTFLFCDTNLRELKVYSEYYYNGFCPPEITEAVQNHRYHYYFLTQIDTPWEADDLRDRPHDRSTLFRIFESELRKNDLPFTLLEGSEKERFTKATQVLTLLKQ